MNSSSTKTAFVAAGLIVLLMASVAFADHSGEPVSAVDVPTTMASTQSDEHTDSCVISANLTIGSRGEAVECLQRLLIREKFLTTSATGYFGTLTKSAVEKWQADRNVPVTGFFGALSRKAFVQAYPEVSAHMHEHKAISVATWPSVPSVTIVLHKDTMSGFNLEVKPINFTFAPQHVNGEVLPNEGHVHVMIDGVKLARLYGSWMHIPSEAFKGEGPHEVLVTLNANDHSDLEFQGARIEAKASITTN